MREVVFNEKQLHSDLRSSQKQNNTLKKFIDFIFKIEKQSTHVLTSLFMYKEGLFHAHLNNKKKF